MKNTYKYIFQNEFISNVLKLSTSTIFSGITVAITLPIITTIFSASDLGKYQLLISIITLFGVVSSLKYEMAIVLPKDETVAEKVFKLCFLVLLIFCLFLGIILFFAENSLLKIINAESIAEISFLIPIGVFFFGLFEIIKYGLLRKKMFSEFSLARLYQVLSAQSLMIIFGWIKPTILSLFSAFITGLVFASALYIKKSIIRIKATLTISIIKVAVRFKKFPLFNSPMVFANTLSNELPVFFLAKYYSTEILGYYMLANRLLIIPMTLIGTAINKVYFQKASETFNRNKTKVLPLYIKTTKRLIALGLLPFIVIIVLSPAIIEIIFGKEWADSGLIMQIMAIGIFFKFTTSPIGTTFTVINKQEIAFYLTLFSLFLRFGVMLYFHESLTSLLWAITLSTTIYYVIYHFFIYRLLSKISKDNT